MPFILIYIFNWTVFVIILVNLLYKAKRSNVSDMKDQKKKMQFKQQFIIAITLSILFGLGWGIGLPATQNLQKTIVVRDIFASLFVLLTSFQGLFIFFMHCIRSPDIRQQWVQWFKLNLYQSLTETSTSSTFNSKKRKISSDTKSTGASKVSDRYKFAKKPQDSMLSSSSAGDEFFSESDANDGLATLRRNVEKNKQLEKKMSEGADGPHITCLPFIEEDEDEDEESVHKVDLCGSIESLSSGNGDLKGAVAAAATLKLEGIIGNEDFDIFNDNVSIGRFSTVSDEGNVIFSNPIEMQELQYEHDPFTSDSKSVASMVSMNESSQTTLVNPFDTDV